MHSVCVLHFRICIWNPYTLYTPVQPSYRVVVSLCLHPHKTLQQCSARAHTHTRIRRRKTRMRRKNQNEMKQHKNHLSARVRVVFAHSCSNRSVSWCISSNWMAWLSTSAETELKDRRLKWFAALFIYATEFLLLRRRRRHRLRHRLWFFFFVLFLVSKAPQSDIEWHDGCMLKTVDDTEAWFATTGGYTRPVRAMHAIVFGFGIACASIIIIECLVLDSFTFSFTYMGWWML